LRELLFICTGTVDILRICFDTVVLQVHHSVWTFYQHHEAVVFLKVW